MVLFLTGLLVVGSLLAAAIACAVWYVRHRNDPDLDHVIPPSFALIGAPILLIAGLFMVAVMLGEVNFESVPVGCYRISDTSGTGVGVVGGKAGVIVTSGKQYEPISCPAR